MSRLRTPGRVALVILVVVVVVVAVFAALTARPPVTPEASAGPSPTSAGTLGSIATPNPIPTSSPAATPTATGDAPPTANATPTAGPSDGTLSLAELLDRLTVGPELDRAGYDRDLFPHWIDADGDGCDTRREVLIAEAVTAPTVGADCWLTGGSWWSLYDGRTLTDIGSIDIDHVVALAEAWDSGAAGWPIERRTAFANDLGVTWALIAVSSGSNRSKSDQDPADWLPPSAGARCPFLSMWLAVKVRWALTVDLIEREAIVVAIDGCAERMPVVAAP